MLASRALPASTPTVLLPECISPDFPFLFTSGLTSASPVMRSSLRHGEDEIGGAVTRPHRSFDGCRQPRISPIPGEKQISEGRHRPGPEGILLRRGLKRRAAFAH